MDANKKLTQYLQHLVFSLLAICFMLFTSCEQEVIAEYSFLNKLEEDIELFIYVRNDSFEGKVNHLYNISKGGYVKFITLKTNDRSGFGEKYFIERLDSVKLRVAGDDFFIAVWRAIDEFEYADGYESLPDFFAYNNWDGVGNRIQHGGSHAEYRFTLQLQEQ
jgi:hypothetical protein